MTYGFARDHGKGSLLAALLLVASAFIGMASVTESEAATDPTYGTSTDIDIAPGMRYTWTPAWSIDGVTTTIEKQTQGTLTGSTVSIATFSAGQLTVNIPGNAAAGTQYHVVLKGATTNPVQIAYVYIIFNVSANLSMTVSQADVIVGTSVTITPAVSGLGTKTFSASGLPSFLALDASTGKIAGTCNTVGPVSFQLTVTTDKGETVTKTVSFTVAAQLTMSVSQANVVKGTVLNITPSASGGLGTKTFSSTDLPSYLSLNASTGKITGTCNTVGPVSFTVKCTTSHGETVSKTVNFTVVDSLTLTNSPLNGIVAMPS